MSGRDHVSHLGAALCPRKVVTVLFEVDGEEYPVIGTTGCHVPSTEDVTPNGTYRKACGRTHKNLIRLRKKTELGLGRNGAVICAHATRCNCLELFATSVHRANQALYSSPSLYSYPREVQFQACSLPPSGNRTNSTKIGFLSMN